MSENKCPISPYSSEGDKFNETQSPTEKKAKPYTRKQATTKKPKKTNPIESPYAKFSITSDKSPKYSKKNAYIAVSRIPQGSISSYIPKRFCPIPYLLIDRVNALLIDNSGHKLYINGRL
jgi:hypothetical protein